MTEEYNELVGKTEIMIVVTLFFVTTIEYFFKIFRPEDADIVPFNYTTFVAYYLLIYVIIYFNKKNLEKNEKLLKFLIGLIIVHICFFILIILYITNTELLAKLYPIIGPTIVHYSFIILLSISFFGIPIIIFVYVLLGPWILKYFNPIKKRLN